MKRYSFEKKLKEGRRGERLMAALLRAVFGVAPVRANIEEQHRGIDFLLSGLAVEVKTDMKAARTRNLFIETTKDDGSAGGHVISESDVIITWVPATGDVYWLNTTSLQQFLEEKGNKYREVTVYSTNWKVKGRIIPIMEVLRNVDGFRTKLNAATEDKLRQSLEGGDN